jgi:hypothetical protein
MSSNPQALARPTNPNKHRNVVPTRPTSKLPSWVKAKLKDKADSLGEAYYIQGEDIKFPKFASKTEQEWFQYYWSVQWSRK